MMHTVMQIQPAAGSGNPTANARTFSIATKSRFCRGCFYMRGISNASEERGFGDGGLGAVACELCEWLIRGHSSAPGASCLVLKEMQPTSSRRSLGLQRCR